MGYKIERLQERIKFKIANVIQRDLSDPRLGMVTITRVKLARDLSECQVYYSVLGTDSAKPLTQRMLDDSCGFIQKGVASILATRRAPRLEFVYDESIEGAIRISEKLREALGPAKDVEDDVDDEAEDDDVDADEEAADEDTPER